MRLQTTFTPADFEALAQTDLSGTTCVVLDILRATSSMITALANGAEQILPVATIEEALAAKAEHPEALLCGERDGLRITATQTGGTEFDLGNSPREYTAQMVAGKTLITTTTNGTRALRACANANQTLVASFLNLTATTDYLRTNPPANLVIVCGGTHEEAALEDSLAAGAIADALWDLYEPDADDSTQLARQLHMNMGNDLQAAMSHARNGRRLLSLPDLADDVAECVAEDIYSFSAELVEGKVSKLG